MQNNTKNATNAGQVSGTNAGGRAGFRACEIWQLVHDVTADDESVDISHSRTAVRLTGDRAADTLAKLGSADFSDHMTPNGAALGNGIAGVTCDIVRDDQRSVRSYLLLLDGSFITYFLGALHDAASEF